MRSGQRHLRPCSAVLYKIFNVHLPRNILILHPPKKYFFSRLPFAFFSPFFSLFQHSVESVDIKFLVLREVCKLLITLLACHWTSDAPYTVIATFVQFECFYTLLINEFPNIRMRPIDDRIDHHLIFLHT